MRKIKFLKLKKESLGDFFNGEFELCTIDSIVKWARSEYAKDYHWYNERDFVENPTDDDSRYWNTNLAEIIKLYENGELVSKSIGSCGDTFLVLPIYNQEICFVLSYLDELDKIDTIDVTDEYIEKLTTLINPNEIEEFVKTHTADEIRDKYCCESDPQLYWSL